VLVAAATLVAPETSASLESVGAVSQALSPVLPPITGRLVFSVGVLGASMVTAVVLSLVLAWGVGEVAGYRRSLEYRPFEAARFYVWSVAHRDAARRRRVDHHDVVDRWFAWFGGDGGVLCHQGWAAALHQGGHGRKRS